MAIVAKETISQTKPSSESLRVINIVYPVGTDYRTGNLNFDPNDAWIGTTWTLITTQSTYKIWRRTA